MARQAQSSQDRSSRQAGRRYKLRCPYVRALFRRLISQVETTWRRNPPAAPTRLGIPSAWLLTREIVGLEGALDVVRQPFQVVLIGRNIGGGHLHDAGIDEVGGLRSLDPGCIGLHRAFAGREQIERIRADVSLSVRVLDCVAGSKPVLDCIKNDRIVVEGNEFYALVAKRAKRL